MTQEKSLAVKLYREKSSLYIHKSFSGTFSELSSELSRNFLRNFLGKFFGLDGPKLSVCYNKEKIVLHNQIFLALDLVNPSLFTKIERKTSSVDGPKSLAVRLYREKSSL